MATALLLGNALRRSSCGELGVVGIPSGSGILQAPESPSCTATDVYYYRGGGNMQMVLNDSSFYYLFYFYIWACNVKKKGSNYTLKC